MNVLLILCKTLSWASISYTSSFNSRVKLTIFKQLTKSHFFTFPIQLPHMKFSIMTILKLAKTLDQQIIQRRIANTKANLKKFHQKLEYFAMSLSSLFQLIRVFSKNVKVKCSIELHINKVLQLGSLMAPIQSHKLFDSINTVFRISSLMASIQSCEFLL